MFREKSSFFVFLLEKSVEKAHFFGKSAFFAD